jgi:hypothetical protein
MGQQFKEWDATRPGSQVFTQQGFGEPEVLPLDCLFSKGLKLLPSCDKAAYPKMQRGKEPPSFCILMIECEQLL